MKHTIYLDIQQNSDFNKIPTAQTIKKWIRPIFIKHPIAEKNIELTIRFVDSDEIQAINAQYRNKDKPTNVLSFPSSYPVIDNTHFIGDLIICMDVVNHEAIEQQKTLYHHLTHIIVHGVLHLLGYDHIDDNDASIMEALEIEILKILNIENPYLS